jgi:hypothetical protein
MENVIFTVALYLGILGFLVFIYVFLSGLRVFKPKAKLKLHKRLAIFGFVAMCIHGLVMCYYYFFA